MLDPTVKNPVSARATGIKMLLRAYPYLLLVGVAAGLILVG